MMRSSAVGRNEYAVISVIILFVALYAMRIGCTDAADPVDPGTNIMTIEPVPNEPVPYPPETYPPGTYPPPVIVEPVPYQPYPQPYPQPYQPYPRVRPGICPGGLCVVGTRSWKRPNYTPNEPIKNFLKFLFVPRWRQK